MSGPLVLSGIPTVGTQAANKNYVDQSNLSIKATIYTQVVAATTWTIVHNKSTRSAIVQVIVGDDIVIPDTVRFLDDNTIELTFGDAVSGKTIVSFCV